MNELKTASCAATAAPTPPQSATPTQWDADATFSTSACDYQFPTAPPTTAPFDVVAAVAQTATTQHSLADGTGLLVQHDRVSFIVGRQRRAYEPSGYNNHPIVISDISDDDDMDDVEP
jgi:hypothetical protein